MKATYTKNKFIRKVKVISYSAIGMIIINVFLLLLEDFSSYGRFGLIGELLDKLIFIGLGLILLISSTKKIKTIKNDFIEIDCERLHLSLGYKTPNMVFKNVA